MFKASKATFSHGTKVSIYIFYEITKNNPVSSYPTLEKCLLGAVKSTKEPDIYKCKYSGYGIGFDRKGKFSFGIGFGHRYGVDMSSSTHIDNKKTDILILGEEPGKRLHDTTLAAEKKYSINFTENNKKFCLRLHYNGANNYLFVNGKEIIKFKAKDSEIVANPLYLVNISEDFCVDNVTKTGLYEYVHDFSVDYRAIAVDDILNIHKYLMEKDNII